MRAFSEGGERRGFSSGFSRAPSSEGHVEDMVQLGTPNLPI